MRQIDPTGGCVPAPPGLSFTSLPNARPSYPTGTTRQRPPDRNRNRRPAGQAAKPTSRIPKDHQAVRFSGRPPGQFSELGEDAAALWGNVHSRPKTRCDATGMEDRSSLRWATCALRSLLGMRI